VKAEANHGSFTVFADDRSIMVLVEARHSGWWAVVFLPTPFGVWESKRSLRLDSVLDLGALLVATFGEATSADTQTLVDDLAIAQRRIAKMVGAAERVCEYADEPYTVCTCSGCGRRLHSGTAKYCGTCGTKLDESNRGGA
jgi:hypothetical protein